MTKHQSKTPQLPKLSSPELEILKTLWSREQLSAREVHQRAGEGNGWAYSTTRTQLERMAKKGLIDKRQFHGIYLYAAAISRVRGLAGRIREFADRVLEMDPAPVVSLFAQGERLSAEEIAELERLLEEEGR